MNLIFLLQLAGLTHLGLVCAGLLMPKVVGLKDHTAGLPPFIRRLLWVYYAFIGWCLVGFGLLTFMMAEPLSSGEPLARFVCGFLCIFWTIRLVVALWVLDVRPYLTNRWRMIGYQATNIVFGLLPVLYGWAALKGGTL